jgi:hypothetical protein
MTQENILLTRIVADNAQFKAKLNDAVSAARSFGDKVSESFRKAGGILAGVAIGKEVLGTFKDGYDSIDKMTASAERLGISSKNFQYLEFAAKRSDVEIGSLEATIKKLRISLSNTSKAPLFAQLGLDQAKLKLMDTSEALSLVYDSMKNLDEYSRVNIGTKLFGKNFQDTISLARQGMKGFREDLNKLGGPVDTSGFDAVDKRVDELTTKYENFKKRLFLNYGAPLVDAANTTLDVLDGSYGYNKDHLAQVASGRIGGEVGKNLPDASTSVFNNQHSLGDMPDVAGWMDKLGASMVSLSTKVEQTGSAADVASQALLGVKDSTYMDKVKGDLGLDQVSGNQYLSSILQEQTQIQDKYFTSAAESLRHEIASGGNPNGSMQQYLATMKNIAESYNKGPWSNDNETNSGMLAAYELLKKDVAGIRTEPVKVVIKLEYNEGGILKAFATSSGMTAVMENAVRTVSQKEASSTMASGG